MSDGKPFKRGDVLCNPKTETPLVFNLCDEDGKALVYLRCEDGAVRPQSADCTDLKPFEGNAGDMRDLYDRLRRFETMEQKIPRCQNADDVNRLNDEITETDFSVEESIALRDRLNDHFKTLPDYSGGLRYTLDELFKMIDDEEGWN